MKKLLPLWSLALLLLLAAFAGGCSIQWEQTPSAPAGHDVTIYFPSDRYPETAEHIRSAVSKGASSICTIEREGAEENRKLSLKGVPTKKKYDRDEWPMAMCREGGNGADVAYVKSSDNRGAGSWIGNQLSDYPDGTRVRIVVR